MPKKSNGERKPIQKITSGLYEIEGIIENEKSKFQPSFLLFGKDGTTYSVSGHLAKQLEEYFDRLQSIEFSMEVEELYSEKFDKPFLDLVELKKLKDKERPTSQVKLTGF